MLAARPLPIDIGLTENALRAVLNKTLASTQIHSYEEWGVLNAASNAETVPACHDWKPAVADALKLSLGDVHKVLTHLQATGLVRGDGALTAQGATELATGRTAVSVATARLIDGVAEEQQTTVRVVLEHVRRRAEEMLRM